MEIRFNLKRLGRCVLFVFALTMMLFGSSNMVNAEENRAGNVTWKIVDEVLYISPVPGTNGAMTDYEEYDGYGENESKPWEDETFTKVVVNSGVTSIGDYAFENMDSLTRVELPDSVTRIGSNAFESCDNLAYINIPKKVSYIGDGCFGYVCSGGTKFVINFQGTILPKMGEDIFCCVGLYETAEFQVQNPNVKVQLDNYILYYDEYPSIHVKVIGKTPIQSTTISGIVNRDYTGKPVTQNVIIKLGTYQLKNNTDYKVSYVNNVNVGTATVQIQGIGAFTGVATRTFKISPKMNKKTATTYVGKTVQLSVVGAKGKITWTTSNSKIVTVDSKGKVLGKKKGTATITATTGGCKVTCKITVNNPSLSKTSTTLYVGKSATIKVKNGTGKVSYKTSNKKIATVNSKGKVTAKAKGKVTITVTVSGVKLTYKVTVKNPAISKSSLTLYVGDKETIKVNGVDSKLVWKSSNKKIATVSSSGKITAKKKGTVTISTTYKGKTYKCKVTVKDRVPIIIQRVDWQINFLDGLEPEITFKNNSNKVIKYVVFETAYYTRFAEPAYCEISGYNTRNLRVTGPIQPGQVYTAYWGAAVYNSQISRMDINKITVTYTDGSKRTMKYNKFWHDSYYYG